jgi:hypothetical protein
MPLSPKTINSENHVLEIISNHWDLENVYSAISVLSIFSNFKVTTPSSRIFKISMLNRPFTPTHCNRGGILVPRQEI